MRQASIEFSIAVVGTALSIIGVLHASEFPRDAGYFPMAVLALLASLLFVWSVKCIFHLRKGISKHLAPKAPDVERFLIIASASIVLVTAVPWIGFATSFFIFVPTVGYLLGYRKWKNLLLTTAVFSGMVSLVFVILLNRPLPKELLQYFN